MKKYYCPYCNAVLKGSETACPNCGSALTPVKKPVKKSRVFLVIGIILAALLAIAVFFLWYFRAWFFAPKLDTSAFTAEAAIPSSPAKPAEKEMEAVAKYIEGLTVQTRHRLSFSERNGAGKMETVAEYLSSDDPDLEAMCRALGVKVTSDGTGDRSIIVRSNGTAEMTETEPESGEPEEVPPTDLVITLPSKALHSSSKLKLGPERKESVKCKACGYVNPPNADVCEKCGTELFPSDYYAEVDSLMPTASGSGLTEAQRQSYLLTNVSSTLLMANRPNLAFYMTCLACAKDPENVSAIVSLVTHLRMREALDEALIICNHGLQMDPAREELYVHAANISVQLDRPDDAIAYVDRCNAANGFSGPAYQAAMFAYLQKKDYPGAFRAMLNGAKDGFTSSIRLTYEIIRLRGDYFEFAGSVFKDYTIRSLMDFSMNRSGFNPAAELAGKVVDIGKVTVPSSPEDWLASAEPMIKAAQNYLRSAIDFYKEDIEEIGMIYNILLNSGDIKDLASGFLSSFGDKLKKKKLTEAERVISYEQEKFWMDILDDYREWKVKEIRDEMNRVLDSSEMTDFIALIDKYLLETREKLESINMESTEGLLFALEFMMERVIGNHSIGFTSSESALIVSKIKNALAVNGRVRNKAYQEIAEVCHDYFMFANTLLSMIADDDMYQEYRRKITFRVTADQGLCVVEGAFFAYVVPILAEPYLMIGSQAQEGIGSGVISGTAPPFPKFIISNKPPRPSADMYGDIEIPDISAITGDVLGVDLSHQADNGDRDYPAMRDMWELNWKETHPGEPIPAAPNFNDSMERIRFWNSLTPEQRVRYSAVIADPGIVNKAIVLDLYCARGQSAIQFTDEKISLFDGLSLGFGTKDHGVSVGADGTVSGKAKIGIGTLAMDSKGNVSVTMQDKISGLEFGVSKTGRDLTFYTGTDLGLAYEKKRKEGEPETPSPSGASGSVGGAGVKANAQVYATYDLWDGKITSGGAKTGAKAVLGGLIGVGITSNINVVQGISTSEAYLILASRKVGVKIKQDYNYDDPKEKNDVPGLQEFQR